MTSPVCVKIVTLNIFRVNVLLILFLAGIELNPSFGFERICYESKIQTIHSLFINHLFSKVRKSIFTRSTSNIDYRPLRIDKKEQPCFFEEVTLFSINFSGNGATCGSMVAQTIEEGTSDNLNTNLFDRNGYAFLGWNTAADGSGLSYSNNTLFTMGSSDITLFAQWSQTTYFADAGDYRSRTSGNWGVNTTWEKFDGSCWISCPTGEYPNSPNASVTIANGHTIDNDGSGSPPWNVEDLIVEAGGKLWDNQFGGINTYVQVYGDILCNGVIGDVGGDDISFDIAGGNNCTISGSGSFTAMRIRKDNDINPSQTTDLTISMDISLIRHETSGTVLYNDANEPGTDLNGSFFNVTIDSGVTLKCMAKGAAMSHVSIDGLNGADPENCGGTCNVYGTLDMDGAIYLKNNNSAKNTIFRIKNGGLVNCRYVETGASGVAGNNLTIENGGKLTISGSVDTVITTLNSSTWNGFSSTNNTWDFQQGSWIEYSGQTEQKIHGISRCSNFMVSGGGLKVLENDFNIEGILELSNGVIQTGYHKLIHESINPLDLVHTSGGSSFIFGTYRRYLVSNSNVYEFPVGLSAVFDGYRRLDMLNNHLSGLSFIDASVSSLNESGDNIDSRLTCFQDSFILSNVLGNTIWSLRPNTNPLGGSYGVRLYANGTGLNSIDDNNFFAVKRSDGSADYASWDTFSGSTTIPENDLDGRLFSNGDGYAQRLGYTSFSEHAIGLKQTNQALPVELIDFWATCTENETTTLHWITASEYNSSHFKIEKSENGILWTELGIAPAAGNSQNLLNYFFKDRLESESIYYRLSQVDMNGTVKVFEPIAVNCDLAGNYFTTLPNPSSHDFNIIYRGKQGDDPIFVHISDTRGSILHTCESIAEGSNIIPVEKLNLPPGTYFVSIRSSDGTNQVVRHQIF